jgi:hypothetical protein
LASRTQYPKGFPLSAQARVEAAKIEGTHFFNELRAEISSENTSDDRARARLTTNLLGFVMDVFAVFADEACKLGRHNIWDIVTLRENVERFLFQIACEAYEEKGFDLKGKALIEIVWPMNGTLTTDTERYLKNHWDQWKEYEVKLLEVARLQAGPLENIESNQDASIRGESVDDSKTTPADTTKPTPTELPVFPKRAAWLKERLKERGDWSPYKLKKKGGPDPKTTKKSLRGHAAREDALDLMIVGLNKTKFGGRTLTSDDIPTS